MLTSLFHNCIDLHIASLSKNLIIFLNASRLSLGLLPNFINSNHDSSSKVSSEQNFSNEKLLTSFNGKAKINKGILDVISVTCCLKFVIESSTNATVASPI